MGTVYARGNKLWIGYVTATGKRRQVPTEHRPGDEPKARADLAALEAGVKAQRRLAPNGVLTVNVYAQQWLKAREARGLNTVRADRSRLKHHVLPALGELPLAAVEPLQCMAVVDAMNAKGLAPRTVLNTWGALHRMFADALFERLIPASPAVLPRGRLPVKRDADPEWRAGASYDAEEAVRLMSDLRIPRYRRVLYALCLLGGLRSSEACALRWRHWDPTMEPLGRLLVAGSWSSARGVVKGTKTGGVRSVPVHPRLAIMLTAWKAQFGAGAEDPILHDGDAVMNENTNRKRLHADLALLGMRDRGVHDMRATHQTLLEDADAKERIWKRWTHGDPHDVVGGYLRTRWAKRCQEMMKVTLPDAEKAATPALQAADVADITWSFGWRRWELNPPPRLTLLHGDGESATESMGVAGGVVLRVATGQGDCSSATTVLPHLDAAVHAAAVDGPGSAHVVDALWLALLALERRA